MPIDYSKWKAIEVSDDEDDTHPNIDTPSLFRWRHQARLERMAEMQQEKEEVESAKKQTVSRIQEIEDKLKETSLEEKDRIKLELEKQKIKDEEEKFLAKEKELADKERLQPWNVDTIGHEAWSKSRINKASDKKKQPEQQKLNEEEDSKRMAQYFSDNEELLRQYALLDGFEKCEEFLLEHPLLASDYAASYITIEALNLAIEYKDEEMAKYAANCITLQYLLELAKSLNALATNTNVIKNFFKKIKAADAAYMKMYYDEVEAFKDRLRKRAQTKRDEAVKEFEQEEREKRIAQAPGGIDPQEVFDSLPQEMQDAFSSQDMQKLYHVAEAMDPEVFQHHLQRCIDSGLWIPNAKEQEEKEKAAAAAAAAAAGEKKA